MKIAKNMEAIFIVAVTLVCATAIATASTSTTEADLAVPYNGVTANAQGAAVENIQTVTVSVKRMTAAEKARFGA